MPADNQLIADVGEAIWGPNWQPPLAAALVARPATVADWAAGREQVPADVWKELREIARLHALKLADLGQAMVTSYDAAVQRDKAKLARREALRWGAPWRITPAATPATSRGRSGRLAAGCNMAGPRAALRR